jgi:ubiquinone/menaquinone biosynthesis C-methylase UbiE
MSDSDVVEAQYKNASNLNARIQLHTLFSTNKYGWCRWVFDRLELPRNCQILEVGAGPGDLWLRNRDRLPDSWVVTVTDASPGMLEKTKENLAGNDHPFTFRVVDAQSIPFDDGSFDGVIANHMLYHVPDLNKGLSELRRVLKPGGRFYASTIGWSHMQGLRDLVCEFDPSVEYESPSQMISFALENGRNLLSTHFPEIEIHRYEDALLITAAEPLVAYVRSMATVRSTRINVDPTAFSQYVEAKIASQGAIHIVKDSGLFAAVR